MCHEIELSLHAYYGNVLAAATIVCIRLKKQGSVIYTYQLWLSWLGFGLQTVRTYQLLYHSPYYDCFGFWAQNAN